MSMVNTATAAQLAELKLSVPRIGDRLNEDQLDTLATNLDLIIRVSVTDTEVKEYALRDLLRKMVADEADSYNNLIDLVRHINFKSLGPMIDKQIEMAIALAGFAIQPVFSMGDGTPSYAYTMGLNFRTGIELLAVAGEDARLLQYVVGRYAKLALAKEDLLKERNDVLKMSTHVGYGVRTKCVPVAASFALENYMHGKRGEVTQVYQIIIADKNNLFPDESGYDVGWNQPRLPRVKAEG
jgi:hypothetical protein